MGNKKKHILIIIIVGVIVVLGFILSRDKTVAPTTETPVAVRSEANNAIGGSDSQTPAPTNNNANNNQPMQLEIKTTQSGTGDRVVKSGDTIDVYYTGKLTDGKTFDSNVGSGKPFEFTVGAGMVIQGWEQGFIGAKVGEKRTLTIPANLGYGATGAGNGVIPPNATLIFDVELVSIK